MLLVRSNLVSHKGFRSSVGVTPQRAPRLLRRPSGELEQSLRRKLAIFVRRRPQLLVLVFTALLSFMAGAVWWHNAIGGTHLIAATTATLCGAMLLVLITRQIALLAKVRRSESQYRVIVETASHIIVTISPAGLITSVNAAALGDNGYERHDLLGRSFVDFVDLHDVHLAGAFVARAFRGDETRFTLRFRRKTGEGRWLEGALSPIREGAAVTGVLCICRDITEERAATNRLRAGDQRFRTIVDTSFEGIWTVDRNGLTDYVNQRLTDMLGYAASEMIGRDVYEYAPAWEQNPTSWVDRERMGAGGVLELKLQRKDGSSTWVMMSTSPLIDSDGAWEGALAMVTDISEQKRVEQELRDASDHLAAIIETQYEIASADLDVHRVMELIVQRTQSLTGGAGAAIELISGGGEMVYEAASGVVAPLLGRRMPQSSGLSGLCARTGELVACSDTETDPRVDRDLARSTGVRSVIAVPLLYERQVIGILEQAALTPDFFTERDSDTLRLMAGVLAAALGHAREFEEKKRLIAARTDALTALQASQERFRTAFECSAVGMTLTSADGKFTQANAALCEMLGYTPEELAVVRFEDITHPEDREASKAAIGRLFAGEVRSFQMEKRYIHKRGDVVWVLLGVSVAHDADGFPLHFVSQMVDITQRKRAEAERHDLQLQLAQSSKMQAVGQLVSGVAHELNNPLAAILGFSELLLHDCRDTETRESLNIIFGQAQRSRAIVRDLLSFVRHSEGRQRTSTDIGELLDRVSRTLSPAAQAVGVALTTEVSGLDASLPVDRAGLEQVFTNLVMNAVQAAGADGKVRVSASTVDDRLEIAVEDTGPGIEAAVFPHLFEPFFTTKPVGQGTGLGLPVSLGIVQQHGGAIRPENRPASEGGGARFVVSLPLSIAPPDANPAPHQLPAHLTRRTPRALSIVRADTALLSGAPEPAGSDASDRRPHVLIIDDEMPIRNALRRFFEKRGWVVEEAGDGEKGLHALMDRDSCWFDVMVCDLRMPGMSGMELYAALAVRRPELLARLIFATGDVVSGEAAAFLQETHCPVLEKPYELSLLAETVEMVRRRSLSLKPAATG